MERTPVQGLKTGVSKGGLKLQQSLVRVYIYTERSFGGSTLQGYLIHRCTAMVDQVVSSCTKLQQVVRANSGKLYTFVGDFAELHSVVRPCVISIKVVTSCIES